ncbi:MAG: hypothetical protein Q8914_10095 [Bacteroidota bacterium]|nr:hypothetical protein [Bacteroidota bacterium]
MITYKLDHIAIILLFCALTSCVQEEPSTYETGNDDNTEETIKEENFTPNSLIGKTIKIDSEDSYYDFTSSGSCSAYCSTLENVYGKPSYTYSQTTGTQAKFWAEFVDKRTYTGSYTKTAVTYYRTTTIDYTLSFTSESAGTYSGTLTISTSGYRVGSIYVSGKTSLYSPKGKFSIY